VGGLLHGGRGKLTSAAQRRMVIELIGEVNNAGADGDARDRRKGRSHLVRSTAARRGERQWILLTCDQPDYASQPPEPTPMSEPAEQIQHAGAEAHVAGGNRQKCGSTNYTKSPNQSGRYSLSKSP